jgi:hypothetical protein
MSNIIQFPSGKPTSRRQNRPEKEVIEDLLFRNPPLWQPSEESDHAYAAHILECMVKLFKAGKVSISITE